MKKIKLTQNKYALIDDDDFERINQYKWAFNKSYIIFKNKKSYKYGYAFRTDNKNKKQIRMHRFIMNVNNKKIVVDHIDHNALNNQKNNLRVCTHSENAMNQKIRLKKDSKKDSNYKGVSKWSPKNGSKKIWRVDIGLKNSKRYIGSFNSEIEAARAYDKVALKVFGKFAFLNFPIISN